MLNGSLCIAACLMMSAAALGGPGGELGADTALRMPSLQLSAAAALQPEPGAAPGEPEQTPTRAGEAPVAASEDADRTPGIPFGRAGSDSLAVGFGYFNDFDDIQAGEVHVGFSHFLCDELEFNVELTGWYFDQNDDTGGLNPGMNLRWHFLHDDDFNWSVYGEAGIGLLFAFDNVPDTGTGFNFSPRAGGGATFRLTDDGVRLQVGVRWQHFSNGRIEGDGRNPGLDAVMGYVGIVIPLN